MKRLLPCILALLLLLACVPTPEEDAVRQKDTNILIDAVRSQEQESAPEPYAAPERFTCDFVTDTRSVHVIADAPIEVLSDSGTFPMLRVEHRYLSDAERLTVAKRILGSEQLYRYEYHLTRKDLEREIQSLIQEPTAEEKKEWMSVTGSTEEEYEEMLKRRKETLAEYQRQYNSLDADGTPEPLKPWDGAAPVYSKDYRYGINTVQIVRSATETNDLYRNDYVEIEADECDVPIVFRSACLDIGDSTEVMSFNNTHKFGTERIDPKDYDKPHAGASVTPHEAIAQVQSIFEGVCDIRAADVYWANNAAIDGEATGVNANTRYAYLIHLAQSFGSAYMPYCSVPAWNKDGDGGFVRGWAYETLMAAVDGSGKLVSLAWIAPLKVTETVSESAAVLPLTEVEAIFRQQMRRVFANETQQDGTLTVDQVQLGLFRIREKNNLESGFLVPAWYFTGTFEYGEAQKAARQREGFKDWEREYYDNSNPLLIINAIDGSIIDPSVGY